ncbi:uncharacterized protein TNCV_3113921 [Trichonephila clavipes]|nr:uncharacterized protein TNCV_3113921 [Trichonephila clavipes]
MPPRQNKEKIQQFTEFEWAGLSAFDEEDFFCRAIGARVQQDSSTGMRVWNQWIDEHRATRKSGSGRRKVTSARDDPHLLRMAVNDRIVSSRQ